MMPNMSEERPLVELAGEFLAGTLADDVLHRFEARLLEDPAARKAVDQWETRMAGFLGSNASDALRAARKGRSVSVEAERSGPTLEERPRAWSTIAPGVAGMVLHYDHQVGSMVYIVRMEPGARCPVADAGSPEECLLVSGDFSLGDVTLGAGDAHHAPNSVIHGGGHTEAGAVVLIRARDT